MAAKALEEEMYSCFVQLNEEEKKSVVNMIKAFIKGKGDVVARISMEQYNQELEEAERQIAQGNYTTQEELEKEMKTW